MLIITKFHMLIITKFHMLIYGQNNSMVKIIVCMNSAQVQIVTIIEKEKVLLSKFQTHNLFL
jgi:hypothetical protein